VEVFEGQHRVMVRSAEAMQRAQKHPLNEQLFREQFGRLGNTPFELAQVTITGRGDDASADPIMAPKSVLNDLRRQAVEKLLAARSMTYQLATFDALNELRLEISNRKSEISPIGLSVLVRSLEQLRSIVDADSDVNRPSIVYCDFEDIRRYQEAVALARQNSLPIALATLRIIKPTDGIPSYTLEPNRLTLLLSEDGRIVDGAWD